MATPDRTTIYMYGLMKPFDVLGKPGGALGQLFEVAGPPSAALH